MFRRYQFRRPHKSVFDREVRKSSPESKGEPILPKNHESPQNLPNSVHESTERIDMVEVQRSTEWSIQERAKLIATPTFHVYRCKHQNLPLRTVHRRSPPYPLPLLLSFLEVPPPSDTNDDKPPLLLVRYSARTAEP